MPLSEIITPFNACSIGLWTITESAEELQELLSQKCDLYELPENYTHNKRILEWLAVRLILHSILPQKFFDVVYDENGKPFLKKPNGHISISHTKEIVSVMYHETKNCGIDIELLKPRILKVAHKFLRDDEKEFLTEENYLEKLYLIWGAKEVIYKMHGAGGVDFIENLKIHPFAFSKEGSMNAEMFLENAVTKFKIQYYCKNNLFITFAVHQ